MDHHATKRNTVAALEKILYEQLPVLDHGFIRVIDYMGDDSSIVQAARVSYGKGTKKVSEDKGLISYLMRHNHTTPFEMCEIKLHVKLPIFVARQWIRHRTANVNEYSARYSVLPKEFYIPSPEHIATQSQDNNQGRSDKAISKKKALEIIKKLEKISLESYDYYLSMLGGNKETDKLNIARELARVHLPINFYTEWYWKIDLHNLLHFLALRADDHAQYEIRVYAEVILNKIVKPWVPWVYEAFMNYRFNSVKISYNALDIIKKMIAGENITQENSKISKREWRELNDALGGILNQQNN